MSLLESYKTYLTSQNNSPATVKNYIADVSRFIKWNESSSQATFDPNTVTAETIERYRNASSTSLSARSFARHYASLRHFFTFLSSQYAVKTDPFASTTPQATSQNETGYLKEFKDYLFQNKVSSHTIKNYLIDIKQFLSWAQEVSIQREPWQVEKNGLYNKLSLSFVEEYKARLLHDAGFSPVSINRKLSSIRKYFSFLEDKGILHQQQVVEIGRISNIKLGVITPLEQTIPLSGQEKVSTSTESENQKLAYKADHQYSRFAPIRLAQKTKVGLGYVFDQLITIPIAKCIKTFQRITWRGRGAPVFEPATVKRAAEGITQTAIDTAIVKGIAQGANVVPVIANGPKVDNLKKSFYAPYAVSTANMPFHKKIWHLIRHSRPSWYKRYHNYPLAHYINFALLLTILIASGYIIYPKVLINEANENNPIAMMGSSPPTRVLSFRGKLTDRDNLPLTAKIPLRFAIYNSPTASGSALLWQEVKLVDVNPDGTFNASLGQETNLPASILDSYQELYLGVTVRDGKEMRPRQQISTSSFASNAARLQGMQPITANNAGYKNVVLALDSAGNLSIGGLNGTIFQATNGPMTLTGETMFITTNPGSNGDIVLSPDAQGMIDLQRPIFNSTENNNLPGAQGAVEIDDNVAILATSSATPAVLINQNGTGDLISASSSGIARFSLDYIGNGAFAGDLAINGDSLLTSTTTFALANTNTINLLIGGQATAIQLGAKTGATTINNDLLVNGNVTLGDTPTDGISFKGGIAQDTDIIPLTTTGTNDLGSATNPWDNLYVNNIVAGSVGAFGYLQRNDAVLSPITLTDSLNLGATATNSANIHFAGIIGDNSFINSGNFGLGTRTPEANLHVSGTNNGKALAIFNDTGSTSGGEVILTASASGTTRFTLDRGGTMNIIGGVYRIDGNTVISGSSLGSGVTSSSLTSVGTITSGVWNGTVIGSQYGGTGLNTSAATGVATVNSGTWSISSALSSALGGTGLNTSAATGVTTISSGTWSVTPTLSTMFGGTGDDTSATTGVAYITSGDWNYEASLDETRGGTGLSSYTTGDLLYASGANTLNKLGIGSNGACLVSNGSTPTWSTCSGGTTTLWQSTSGALSPIYSNSDLLLGATATDSAKFAFINVNSGTPTASISAGLSAIYVTAEGTLATTANQSILIGGSTTGNITLSPFNGSGTVESTGSMNLATGKTYQIDGTDVLSETDLGAGVTGSSLTSVGTLTSGTWNATAVGGQYGGTGINTSSSTGVPTISSGTWSVTAALSTILGGTGDDTSSTTGVPYISSGNWQYEAALDETRGGTGLSAYTTGDLLYASGANTLASLSIGGTNQCLISNGSAPVWGSCATGTLDYWQVNNGALSPFTPSTDLLLGSTATSSAKFGFLNVNSGTPTASLSANTPNNAVYLTGTGNLATTNMQNLTFGGSTTGSITLDAGTGGITLADATTINSDLTIGGTTGLTFSSTGGISLAGGTISDSTDGVDINDDLEISGGLTIGDAIGDSVTVNAASWTFANDTNFVLSGGSNGLSFDTSTLSIDANSDRVGVGTTTPDGKLTVSGRVTGKALSVFNETGDQHILSASASGTTVFSLSRTGNLIFNQASTLQTTSGDLTLDLAGDNLVFTNGDTLAIGGHSGAAYNAIADALSNVDIADGDSDLFIGDELEVNGAVRFDSSTITLSGFANCSALETASGVLTCGTDDTGVASTNYWQLNNGALSPFSLTADINLGATATSSAKISLAGSLTRGKAAAIINQTESQDIFTASSSGTTRFVIKNNGDIGIGTNAPSHRLTLTDSSASRVKLGITNTHGTNKSGALFLGSGGSIGGWEIGGDVNQNGEDNFYLWGGGSGAFRMVVDSNGNMGIGTTAPTGKLHVQGAATGKALAIFNETGNQDLLTASSSGTTRFVIKNNGDVGIGTAAPSVELEIHGDETETSTNFEGLLRFGVTGGTFAQFYRDYNGSTNFLGLEAFNVGNTAKAPIVFQEYGGNVGIGLSDPIGRFHVENNPIGKALAVFNQTGDQAIFTASSSGTTKFTIQSDGDVDIGGSPNSVDSKLFVYESFTPAIWNVVNQTGISLTGSSSSYNGASINWTSGVNAITGTGTSEMFGYAAELHSADDGDSQEIYGLGSSTGLYDPSDLGAGLLVEDDNGSTAGTMYGITIQLDDTDLTRYDIRLTGGETISNITDGTILMETDSGTNLIEVSTSNMQLNLDNTTSYTERLCHSGSNGATGNEEISDCSGTPGDYAEEYGTSDASIEAGDVVVVDSTREAEEVVQDNIKGSKAWITKATQAYENTILGIVSTAPNDVIGRNFNQEDNARPVALNGRVPVKVSTENGVIKAGDFLTSSSIPGVAMKATQPGHVIGKALQGFSGKSIGKVITFVNISYADPNSLIAKMTLNNAGNIQGVQTQQASTQSFFEILVARLTATFIQAKEASFDNLAITTERVSIAGISLRDYILSVVSEAEITSPVVRTDLIATDVISPLSKDSEISLSLTEDALTIRNGSGANSKPVAKIDRDGNASFSGILSANSVQTNDASISGTLTAGKIVADSIEGLDAKLATLAAQQNTASPAANITNVYNIYTTSSPSASLTNTSATPSATPTQAQGNNQSATTAANMTDVTLPESEILQTDFMDLASASASLAYVPNFRSDFATITQGLMVYETASMADVSISNQLAIGGNLILADTSINVLGATLELQPLRQGNIAFMGGLMELDTEGNLKVAGNALFAKDITVKGKLTTNILAPIPDNDLVVDLPSYIANDNDGNPSQIRNSKFEIRNSSNSGVLAINQLGDVIASGTGRFKDIAAGSLNIVRGVSADTSAIDTVASGSAGLATITAGYTSRTIYSPYVSAESLIYITPRSETTLAVPYLARQTAEDKTAGVKGSFTVQIPTVTTEDVSFNWWIIN